MVRHRVAAADADEDEGELDACAEGALELDCAIATSEPTEHKAFVRNLLLAVAVTARDAKESSKRLGRHKMSPCAAQ